MTVESPRHSPNEEHLPTDDTHTTATRLPSARLAVVSAILVAIGAATAFSYVMSEDPLERGDGTAGAFVQEFSDDFDRPASASLATSSDVAWLTEHGSWSIEIGVAHLSTPDPLFNASTVDVGTSAM